MEIGSNSKFPIRFPWCYVITTHVQEHNIHLFRTKFYISFDYCISFLLVRCNILAMVAVQSQLNSTIRYKCALLAPLCQLVSKRGCPLAVWWLTGVYQLPGSCNIVTILQRFTKHVSRNCTYDIEKSPYSRGSQPVCRHTLMWREGPRDVSRN
jgi:hypothetical protein